MAVLEKATQPGRNQRHACGIGDADRVEPERRRLAVQLAAQAPSLRRGQKSRSA
jgi:hypothetical protein